MLQTNTLLISSSSVWICYFVCNCLSSSTLVCPDKQCSGDAFGCQKVYKILSKTGTATREKYRCLVGLIWAQLR